MALQAAEEVSEEVRARRIAASRSAGANARYGQQAWRYAAPKRRKIAAQPSWMPDHPTASVQAKGFWVYVLKDATGEVVYVGQSRNILSRLGRHLGEQFKRNVVSDVDLYECPNKESMDVLEARLIRHFGPPLNKNGLE